MIAHINVKTGQRNEFVDITGLVRDELQQAGVESGVCYVYVPHTTAAVTINEGADPAVQTDIVSTLERLIPRDENYRHLEGNSDAHLKSSLIGASACIIIEEGELQLGTWQAIYFCEFDGPRHRRVTIKFLKG